MWVVWSGTRLRLSVDACSFSRVTVDRKRFLLLWPSLGAPLIVACTSIVEPPLPSGAEVFSPPPVYSTWRKMTEACSALSGSLAAVTWYQTREVDGHQERRADAVMYCLNGTSILAPPMVGRSRVDALDARVNAVVLRMYVVVNVQCRRFHRRLEKQPGLIFNLAADLFPTRIK